MGDRTGRRRLLRVEGTLVAEGIACVGRRELRQGVEALLGGDFGSLDKHMTVIDR